MNIYSACAWATIILHMVNVCVYAYWRGLWFDMRFHSISSTSIWMNYKCLWHGKRRTQSHKTHAVKQFCAFLFMLYRECIVCGNSNCAVWWHLTSYWALNSHIKAILIALKEKHPSKSVWIISNHANEWQYVYMDLDGWHTPSRIINDGITYI